MRQRSGAGSSKPRRRKAPAAKRRSRVEIIRSVASSASKEELRSALLRRKLSEARRHQRRAEEALRESEHQLHQIIDTVPSFLWSADPTGEPTYVNQRALDYSGMRFEEFKHGGWEAFIHPADFPGTMKAFGHAIETGTSYETVHRLRRWDGEYRWHQARGDPLRDRDGRIIQWYGVAVDIDDAKKAEDRLRRSQAYLSEAQRISNTGSWGINPATREILYWSEECYRIWGFDPAQGVPCRASVFQRIHPDDRGRMLDEVEGALRQKRDYTIEFRIVLPDGTVKYLEAICHHVFSEEGELIQLVGTNADVTERKHAEQALRESERKHRQLIESVPCHFWSVNPNGEPTYVNQRLLDYFGIRFEDQKRDMTVLHPDDVAETERALNHAFQTGESFQRVHRLRRADGEYRWHRVRAEPLRDHEGHIIQWYGFSFDIDEGKKAQDQLRRSEAYLAEAQHLSHTGSFGWTPSTGDFHWSDETFRILEYDSSVKPTMERVVQRVHPDDLAIVRQVIDEASRGDKVDIVHRLLIPDGSVKFLHVLGYALKDAAGNLEIVGAVMDVTERKRAEQALRESEAKFRAAIDGIAGLVAIMGPSGELEAANRPIVEYFGRTVEELKNWGTSDAVHPEDLPRVLESYGTSLATGTSFHQELRLRRFDGEYRWFENRGAPIRDESGRITRWYCLLVDIEDRTRALERLQQLQSDFAHMNRVSMMGELAASLSHEILHPIATARNNARAGMRFLEMNPPNLDEAREALGCVVRDADRAKDIVGRIRNQIKRAPPRKERFDLNEAINEVIVMVRSAIAKNGVSVSARLMDGLVPFRGDRVQLQQVLVNLILNAVEAMSSVEDGPRDLLIRTEQSQTGGILVAVRDSGPGIAPVDFDRVFEPFYTTKTSGIGMGLSICRSIISGHGGRLWVAPNEPRGTVFQFTLPAQEAS